MICFSGPLMVVSIFRSDAPHESMTGGHSKGRHVSLSFFSEAALYDKGSRFLQQNYCDLFSMPDFHKECKLIKLRKMSK